MWKSESPRKEVEVVWACDAKRGVLCRKEGDVNGSSREEEERKALEKMVGQCRGGSVRPIYMEAYIVKHRPHKRVTKGK